MDIVDAVITGKTNDSGKADVDKQIHEYTMIKMITYGLSQQKK